MNRRLACLVALFFAAACHGSLPTHTATPPALQVDQSFRKQSPPPGPLVPLKYPAPQAVRLPNGLQVLLVQRPAGVVTLEIVVRHGAGSVPQGKSGLAALTARMLTEGTRSHTGAELSEAAENLGSALDDDAGRDYSSIGLTLLKEDAARGLSLLAEVVQTPAFDPQELSRVRAEWLEHLTGERQEPQRLASLAGLRTLLGPVLGAPVGGSIPDVKSLTAEDLVAFHRKAYTPGNAALVITGNVTASEMVPLVERTFGTWSGGAWEPELKPQPQSAPGPTHVLLVDRPNAVQTAVFAAQRLPARAQPGYETRQVLNLLLGGLFTSRINQNLREEHAYTYGASSAAIATRSWGALVISTLVETDKTAPALEELRKELAKAASPELGKPILAEEVERAKAALTSSRGAKLETTASVANDTEELFYEGLPMDYFARYGESIGSVQLTAVQEEAKARLAPGQLLVVVVGDRVKIEPELKKTGLPVELAAEALVE